MKMEVVVTAAVLFASIASAQEAPVTSAPPDECTQSVFHPAIAIRLHHEGATVLAFRIGIDGHLTDIHIVQSSGHQELDDAAVERTKCWRYKPALRNGQPVEVPWQASVRWKLEQ
jgi:protein TonB